MWQPRKQWLPKMCIRDSICELAEKFCADGTAEEMKATLTQFYKEYGVGKFGLHKSFRITHDEEGVHIVPILNIAHVKLDDLVGYELPKKKLVDNTEAFVNGKKANNCLLFGDAGTGKSSSIKAIANEYYDRGLRIIEVYKHQFQDLNTVISQIKNRNYKFIIYMDDLSFEEFEIEYKYLKADVYKRQPLVQGLDLEIRKPEAPIPLPFGSVSVAIHREWHEAYIAVGSNMGDSREHIARALGQLKNSKNIRVEKVSELLETLPYGGVEQENFVNGMFEIRTLLTPEELLRELHKIEASEGRERKIHWGPRTLDLDIIFYDDLIYSSEDLVIPHVDMENRYFVLKPLSELAPNFRHPITHKTVAQMLAELPVDLTEGSEA